MSTTTTTTTTRDRGDRYGPIEWAQWSWWTNRSVYMRAIVCPDKNFWMTFTLIVGTLVNRDTVQVIFRVKVIVHGHRSKILVPRPRARLSGSNFVAPTIFMFNDTVRDQLFLQKQSTIFGFWEWSTKLWVMSHFVLFSLHGQSRNYWRFLRDIVAISWGSFVIVKITATFEQPWRQRRLKLIFGRLVPRNVCAQWTELAFDLDNAWPGLHRTSESAFNSNK